VGRLYLASVLDLAARRIPGFSLGEHHAAELAVDARKMAAAGRGGDVRGVIFHTAKGSELTVTLFSKVCARLGVTKWMGRVGLCFDTAVIESRHSTLEFELLSRHRFSAKAQARRAVARLIGRDNSTRCHSHTRCVHRSSTGRSPPNETPGRRRPREPSARIVSVARKYIGWYHGGER
jgi:transposase InsO family protein